MGIVVHCAEAKLATGGTFLERVRRAIEADLYKQKQEMRKLYNPYRNLYLDKCYGESKRPAVDWMDFTVNTKNSRTAGSLGGPAVSIYRNEYFGGVRVPST